MSVRPWRAEIRFHKTGKMGPGNSGAGNLGSRQKLVEYHMLKMYIANIGLFTKCRINTDKNYTK